MDFVGFGAWSCGFDLCRGDFWVLTRVGLGGDRFWAFGRRISSLGFRASVVSSQCV